MLSLKNFKSSNVYHKTSCIVDQWSILPGKQLYFRFFLGQCLKKGEIRKWNQEDMKTTKEAVPAKTIGFLLALKTFCEKQCLTF